MFEAFRVPEICAKDSAREGVGAGISSLSDTVIAGSFSSSLTIRVKRWKIVCDLSSVVCIMGDWWDIK